MIYLDCAATSLQKPPAVRAAVTRAIGCMASPGRGGHRPAMLAADTALACREELAALFNAGDPERVIFTLNATHALNIAIASLVSAGDKVVISGYEHNAVTRPLHALGADVRVAQSGLFDEEAAVYAFSRELPGASCCVCTHISNVFGFILPIERIAGLCAEHGVPLIIDASQSAGVLELDFSALGAEFIAMPGHKSLLGPQGTGVLLCKNNGEPLLYGGTGSDSLNPDMPDFLPDRHEAGTHNITGIAGLLEGVRFVRRKGCAVIAHHEHSLMLEMARLLSRYDRLRLYTADNPAVQTGVLSFVVDGADNATFAERLGRCGLAARNGMHCAPSAHRSAGTIDGGTVRLSFSPFNTHDEIRRGVSIIGDVLKNS